MLGVPYRWICDFWYNCTGLNYANICDPVVVNSSLNILECANNTNEMEYMMKMNHAYFIIEN